MTSHAFAQLTLAYGRDLVRDAKTFVVSAVFPFFFLALFLGMGELIPDNPDGPSFTKMMLPLVLFVALVSVGFFATAVPLVTMRERGTLRLLSTTPVRRSILLLAQAPTRLALAAGQIVVIVAVTAALGYLDPARIPALIAVSLAGLVMLSTLGYLLAAALPSPEAANNVLGFLLPVLMLTSGLILPSEIMPDGFTTVTAALPTTYLADLLNHTLLGASVQFPVWRSYAIILGSTVLFAALAVRIFRWEPVTGTSAA